MRRPLCFFCLLFAFFIWLSLAISPPAALDYSSMDRSSVLLTGTVAAKEYKRKSDDSLQLYVTLKDPAFSQGSDRPGCNNSECERSMCDRSECDRSKRDHSHKNDPKYNSAAPFPNSQTMQDSQEDSPCTENITIPSHYSILCVFSDTSVDSTLSIGSSVTVQGTLRAFSPATNPGEFDSIRYYQILRYAFRLQEATLFSDPVPSRRRRDWLSDNLYRCKRRLSAVLDETLPAEDAGIMKAMLLGEKGFLDNEIKALYQESGIVHIIAISGLHISFLGMGLWKLLVKLRMPRPVAGISCILLILLYGQMTGTGVSSLRAIFMFGLQIIAGLIGRTYDLLTSVSLAGILLLIEQPLYLWHSGFLFSFAAVLSIGLLLPVLPSRGGKILAIPLGSLPIYLLFYHRFPLVSLFLNLLVIPLMGVLLPLGILLLFLGLIATALGALAGFPVRSILFVYKCLCRVGNLLPVPDLVPGAPGTAAVFLYLGFLLFLVFAHKHFSDLCKYLWVSCAVLFLCIHPVYPLEITFLDVGQGDGICIRCQGKTILIDGGSSSTSSLAQYQLTPYLTWTGTPSVDLAILTHDDSDHCNGLIDLLTEDEIKIKQLLLPAIDSSCQGENYQKLEALCQEKNIPILYGAGGDRLQVGKTTLQILHPKKGASYEDVNASSLTILLTYQAFSALLTGDLEKEGEQNLLTRMDPTHKQDLTVLKVAHHGSRYATSNELLTLFSPRIGIISAGRSNRYGHPATETIERLQNANVTLYNTQTNGAITIKTDGEKAFVETFLSADPFVIDND